MSAIDTETVKKVAHLARIAIDDTSIDHIQNDLNNILNLVAEMQAADTDGIAPMAHPLDLHQREREDVVTETNQRDLMQSIAPETTAGLYLVPKVIE